MLRRRFVPLFCLILLTVLISSTSAKAKGEVDGLEYLYWLLFGSAGAAAGVVYVKRLGDESVAPSIGEINTQIAKLDGRQVEAGQDADPKGLFASAYCAYHPSRWAGCYS